MSNLKKNEYKTNYNNNKNLEMLDCIHYVHIITIMRNNKFLNF